MATAVLAKGATSGVGKKMDDRWEKLAIEAKKQTSDAKQQELTIDRLAIEILRSRSMCRPWCGKPLWGIYGEIARAWHHQLRQELAQSLHHYDRDRVQIREWAIGVRDLALQKVLTDARLQKLALSAQCKDNPERRRYALKELVEAIRLCGRLCRPHRHKFPPGFYELLYEEAANKTLVYVCQNIHKYDPNRSAKFMTWVNFRLDKLILDARREFSPPQYQVIPSLADLDNLPQPETPDLSATMRDWIAVDADGAFRREHIRNRPDANFQAIALATLSGRSWEEISTQFQIKIPTLSSFFRRSSGKFAAKFRDYLSP
ncbi:MAG: hypothetical protein SWY16_24570 [Cyanobacteriota bacterium]|nr:hypothetical protein [Cyanobacteriota bacterium]